MMDALTGARSHIDSLSPTARGRETAQHLELCMMEIEQLRRVLHEIAEEWAGAECGEPVTAQEAYAIGLAKRMYQLAADAIKRLG